METLLCLVRHGVTDWNYEGRAQGRVDIPLNFEGVRQAKAVAVKLAGEQWHAIYSSTSMRAFHTAEAIATLSGHSTVIPDERLVERNMGLAEGSTPSDRAMRWPGIDWRQLPGVESDGDLAARATESLKDIAERHPGGRVICAAHGGLISTFLRSIVPSGTTPVSGFHQRNTAITRVTYAKGQFQQVGPSEYDHLLVDGIEYSGEKGRIRGESLKQLALGDSIPGPVLETAILRASAVESAWASEKLVGFARAFTDGVLHGYVDLIGAAPGYERVVPHLMNRLAERFAGVAFTVLERHALQQSGD